MNQKVQLGPAMDPDVAPKVLAIYQANYKECRIGEDANGDRVFTYPECPMVINKDNQEQMGQYFHACDLNAYRAALRACRKGPISCAPIEPKGTERPVSDEDQATLNGVY